MAVAHRASAAQSSTTATTTATITIPAGVQTDDDLYVLVTSRQHSSTDAFVTCVDDDTGGNTWSRLGSTTDRRATLFWKKATGATASKTVTLDGAINSIASGLSAFSGAASGDPTTNIAFEDNASGDETHAGFTPDNADSFVCLGVFQTANDIAVTVLAAATLGSLEPEFFELLNTGGSDCAVIFGGALSAGGPTGTGDFSWTQDNGAGKSLAFAIKPAAVGGATTHPGWRGGRGGWW